MSDELLALRYKRVLELLQKPRKKEHLEEYAKKSFNLTALKEWEEAGVPFEEDDEVLAFIEYKESKARNHPGSIGEIISTKSADKSRRSMEKNEDLEICLGFTPTKMIESSHLTPRVREKSDSTTCKSGKHREKILDPNQYPTHDLNAKRSE